MILCRCRRRRRRWRGARLEQERYVQLGGGEGQRCVKHVSDLGGLPGRTLACIGDLGDGGGKEGGDGGADWKEVWSNTKL